MVPRQSALTPPPPPIAKVDIYTHRFSPDCMRAKALLDHKGAIYSEYVIDSDEESQQVMLYRSGGQASVPQIFINGQAIGGLGQLEGLEAAGQLDQLLGQAPRNIVAEEAAAAAEANGGGGGLRSLLGRFGRR